MIRADYSCLSKKCRKEDDNSSPVYELPVGATRCPVCGSKRIVRLFNKIAVLRGTQQERDPRLTSSSHAVRSGYLLRPGYDHHDQHKAGYTPPGGGVDDGVRYDKLKSYGYTASAPEVRAIIAPGPAAPLTEMEVARDRRLNPNGVTDTLAKLTGRAIPTFSDPHQRPTRTQR
jgi:hypothetical protein